jgi:hypothetical protein
LNFILNQPPLRTTVAAVFFGIFGAVKAAIVARLPRFCGWAKYQRQSGVWIFKGRRMVFRHRGVKTP